MRLRRIWWLSFWKETWTLIWSCRMLSQKQANFKPADLPVVKRLMAKHAASADDELAQMGMKMAWPDWKAGVWDIKQHCLRSSVTLMRTVSGSQDPGTEKLLPPGFAMETISAIPGQRLGKWGVRAMAYLAVTHWQESIGPGLCPPDCESGTIKDLWFPHRIKAKIWKMKMCVCAYMALRQHLVLALCNLLYLQGTYTAPEN